MVETVFAVTKTTENPNDKRDPKILKVFRDKDAAVKFKNDKEEHTFRKVFKVRETELTD